MSEFYNILRNLRKSRGMLQKDVAERLGISVSAYSLYENGTREPSIDRILEIAKLFNVNPNFLLGWTTTPGEYCLDDRNEKKHIGTSNAIPKIFQFLNGTITAEESGYTQEELESICQYVEFVKSKRKNEPET